MYPNRVPRAFGGTVAPQYHGNSTSTAQVVFGICILLSLAEFDSRWSDIIGSSLQGRGEDSAEIAALQPPWAPGVKADGREDAAWKRRITLRIARSLGAARDEVYAVDLNSMGGVIEKIGVWLATKLGEKGIKS